MHVPILLSVLALATSICAQGALPPCAQQCVGDTLDPKKSGCNQIDIKCICSNRHLIDTLACCVASTCDTSGQEATINFAQAICRPQGITDLPSTATCVGSSSAAAHSSTSKPSSQLSSTATGRVPAATSLVGTASSATSAARSSATDTAASTDSTTMSSSLTASITAAESAPGAPTGSAQKVTFAAAGVLGGVVGAAALLL